MARDPNKTFSKTYNTRSRRGYLDFDYLDQLTEEQTKFLAKFSDEYYGADFDINDTYAKKEDLLEQMKKNIKSEQNEKKKLKFKDQLKHYKSLRSEFVQIKGHTDKKINVDLRKVRSIDLYYLDEKGELTKDKSFKYSDKNIHSTDQHKDCGDRTNKMRCDVMSNYGRNEEVYDKNIDVFLNNYGDITDSTEAHILREEEEHTTYTDSEIDYLYGLTDELE